MRKFTFVLFFLVMGMGTMVAQSMLPASISSDFKITLSDNSANSNADQIIELDFSQLNLQTAQRARRVIAGIGSKAKVDFASKKAQVTLPKGFDAQKFAARLQSGIKKRAELF